MKSGDIISYLKMCQVEGINLQRGMNYRLNGGISIFLMSTRKGAPYEDEVIDEGRTLIYEGHDIAKTKEIINPKEFDQPYQNSSGSLTQNGLFFEAAQAFNNGKQKPELIKVYEKIKPGIWAYNGIFKLIDAYIKDKKNRKVFKFVLRLTDEELRNQTKEKDLNHERLIPTAVKREVWDRDGGKCVTCNSTNNLHFDHIVPYSKGGSSLTSKNIQLLCARHNLRKSAKII